MFDSPSGNDDDPISPPPPSTGEGEGGGEQKQLRPPSPFSPPARGGEIFGVGTSNWKSCFEGSRLIRSTQPFWKLEKNCSALKKAFLLSLFETLNFSPILKKDLRREFPFIRRSIVSSMMEMVPPVASRTISGAPR